MQRDSAQDRSRRMAEYRNAGLLRGLSWLFAWAALDRQRPDRLSSHLLRDVGLGDQSAGDRGEPWKRLK
jgi:hypothetical protein